MKRAGNLYSQIWLYENLCSAFLKAARGKNDRPDVIEFRRNFSFNIRKIQEELRQEQVDIGHYRFFKVRDPKIRQICAAAFPERVLHHAIMNICEPVLDRYAIHDSYACRKGKGPLNALKRARMIIRKYDWFLKLDIRKYFDSIDHFIMMQLLARRIKDDQVLQLFPQILDTYEKKPCKGIPIGNLISQHLANFYLGVFDHWIKEDRRIKGYLRYMDDFVLFGTEKEMLKTELSAIQSFLSEHLALELKPIQLNRSIKGLPFLGFRVFPEKILLTSAGKRRFVRKFIAYEEKWVNGEWSEETLVQHMEPLIAYTLIADASGFRRSVIQKHGVPY